MSEIQIEKVPLDSAVQMLKLTYSFELWDQLLELSDKLFNKLNYVYMSRSTRSSLSITERPFLYYFGYSLLMKGLAYKELGNYDSALQCIDQYANLKWFEDLDEESWNEVKYFQYIAEPNRYEVQLLSGDFSILEAYVDFLLLNQNEQLPGSISILKTATTYKHNVDHLIDPISQEIMQSITYQSEDLVRIAYYQSFFIQIIEYKMNQAAYTSAIDYILHFLQFSHQLSHNDLYKYAIVRFESIREHATPAQLNTFKDHIAMVIEKPRVTI